MASGKLRSVLVGAALAALLSAPTPGAEALVSQGSPVYREAVAAREGAGAFAGSGVMLHPWITPPAPLPKQPGPATVAIEHVDGSRYYLQACEFETTGCGTGAYLTVGWLDCWRVVRTVTQSDPLAGSAVLYGGMWLNNENNDEHHWRWYAVKIVDGGIAGKDRMGVRLSTSRSDDGHCGAAAVVTRPLIAGNFQHVEEVSV